MCLYVLRCVYVHGKPKQSEEGVDQPEHKVCAVCVPEQIVFVRVSMCSDVCMCT